VKFGMKADHDYKCKSTRTILHKLTVTNMATVRIFEVMSKHLTQIESVLLGC
jgi:hypothetical protein